MNALNDPTLSEEALKGFFVFLHSEELRHEQDIIGIKQRMDIIAGRLNLTELEEQKLLMAARRYVTF